MKIDQPLRLATLALSLSLLTGATLAQAPAQPPAGPGGPAGPGRGGFAGMQRPDRMGRITEIKGDVFTLSGRQGAAVTVTIPASATIAGMQGAAASRDDLKVDARIAVYGAEKDGTFTATRVIVLPARQGGNRPVDIAPPTMTPEQLAASKAKLEKDIPEITLDTTGAPDLAGFAARSKAICEAMYGPISTYLKTDGFQPPKAFRFVFREMDGVAYTSGAECHFAAAYFRTHPDDYGAVVHEMTHIIQQYRRGNNPGWLVEALDDYVRFYRYEPIINVPHANPARLGNEPEAYRVGAQFLDWVQAKYDKDLVPQLNAAMRDGTYADTIWKDKTGKTLDTLWTEWKATLAPATTTASAK